MVIDASVWISGIVPSDVNHAVSARWLDSANLSGAAFSVPAHFPAEAFGAITRIDPTSPSLALILNGLFDPEFFDIHDVSRELSRFSAEVAGAATLRGSDAIYVALAATLETPLVTWDKQQRERGAVFCRTMSPVEAMALDE